MLFLIIHNIRSALNVGSMFRTADAAGVDQIYITGYTATPTKQGQRPAGQVISRAEKDIAKTALGAQDTVPWEYHAHAWRLINKLKAQGVTIAALELDDKAINIFKYKRPKGPLALIVGNEVKGVPQSLLKRSDAILQIPMRGSKESLNVAVATGIGAYELTKK